MAFTVRRIASGENNVWDQLIQTSPQGDVFLFSFSLNAWANHDPEIHLHRLGCFDHQNNLVGGWAFLHKKKAKVMRVQALLQTWVHIETPILAGHVRQGSQEYAQILTLLAHAAQKLFFYYKFFFHPSLIDLRPLLQNGWSVKPDYLHGWDLSNPEALLSNLKEKKRFRQAGSIFQTFDFSSEKSEAILEAFIPFYKETARHIGYKLRPSFDFVFRAMATEMIRQDVLRFHVCRRKTGELVGIATYVLNPVHKTAYGWQLAHIPLKGDKDFIPAMYLYSIKTLHTEVSFIDIAEGLHPSLYFFKDSLGTKSSRYFIVETPNAKWRRRLIETVRNLKHTVRRYIS